MIPGEIILLEGEQATIVINAGRPTVSVEVTNRGDRPVQVGSHFHFHEANPALAFDRSLAYGRRLDIPAGTAKRFEPGEKMTVTLVDLAGARKVYGHRGAVMGDLTSCPKK